jgi:hypothetical protein
MQPLLELKTWPRVHQLKFFQWLKFVQSITMGGGATSHGNSMSCSFHFDLLVATKPKYFSIFWQ